MTAGKDPERGTGVAHVGETEQPVDNRNGMMQGHGAIDDRFGQLIENNDENQPTADQPPFFCGQSDTPAVSTDAQRPQTVGCVWSRPTCGSYFQQRLHFAPSALRTVIRQFNGPAS